MENNTKLHNIRHSLAHLLASSVLEIFPEAQLGIGPVIENGFYYDFLLPQSLTLTDLKKIEKRMRELIKQKLPFNREEMTSAEAKKFFKTRKQPFKVELIEDIEQYGTTKADEILNADKPLSAHASAGPGPSVSLYKTGQFTDLCRGGHVDNTSEISADSFQLDKISGAYWRGDQTKAQLQRVYGLAFENRESLQAYIMQREEAEKRDHKKLGKELGLFVFSDAVGKGLPLFTPKGSTIRRELERFIVDEELKRGYLHVYTPDIARLNLYKKSGHYPYYKDSMYAPIQIEDEEFMLRPMTCPHHFELYLSNKHSYRELPLRIAELGKCYRYEQSGELMGLLRVRVFCLADAHIVARKPQAKDEIHRVLDLIDFVCNSLGIKHGVDYRYRLSLGDRGDDTKYFKDDASWDEAEHVLRSALQERKASFYEAEKEAAFYGPKIDIQMKNVSGKEDTAFTVQYDFVMPKRFELSYTNEQGHEEQPVVIHRSSIGALERVMAFLIERYAGAFPLWLSPIQVKILPISEKQAEYASQVAAQLKNLISGLRVEIDDRDESVGKRIREASKEKIPYIAVVGDKELEAQQVAVRGRGQEDLGPIDTAAFAELLKQKIETKAL